MKIIRESTHISGFLYETPVPDVPALTHCGEALCARGHALKPHAHPGFEFHYLSRGGHFTWRIGRELVEQKMGEILVTCPAEVHTTGPQSYPETHFLWIGLKLAELPPAGRRLGSLLSQRKCRLLTGCHEAEPVLRGLISQIISRRPRRDPTVLAYLHTFIALLEQRVQSADDQPDDGLPVLPYSHRIQKAVSYLETHLDRRIPLRELTAAATMRRAAHCCSQFRKEVGVAPATYQRRLRLHAARAALRLPTFTITTAALQFGFSSSQHFSACFRREFGISPRRWQQRPECPAGIRAPPNPRCPPNRSGRNHCGAHGCRAPRPADAVR